MLDLEVFRTTVNCPVAAAELRGHLLVRLPSAARVSFDLDDCDRVLRVHTPGQWLDVHTVAAVLWESGYHCEPLTD